MTDDDRDPKKLLISRRRLVQAGVLGGMAAMSAGIGLGRRGLQPPKAHAAGDDGAAPAIKWNPGVGMQGEYQIPFLSDADGWARIEADIAEVGQSPVLKLYSALCVLGVLAPDSDAPESFPEIEKLLALAERHGVHVVLSFWTTDFGHTTIPDHPSGSAPLWPQWMLDRPDAYLLSDEGTKAVFTGYHRAECMTSFIHVLQALGARFDRHPNLEAISLPESSMPWVQDYHPDRHRDQMLRLTEELTALPHTQKWAHINWFGSPDYTRELVHAFARANLAFRGPHAANGWGIGGPDCLPRDGVYGGSWGDRTCRGLGDLREVETEGFQADYGSWDLRGVVPIAYENQFFYSHQRPADDSAAEYERYSYEVIQNTHYIVRKLDYMHEANNWETGALPNLVQTGGRIRNPACPTAFGGSCG